MRIPHLATTYKAVGETPLLALERYRDNKQIPQTTPMAYAGRLDPMASGILLLLIGDTCKKQSQYHNLDKAYDFTTIFGLSSDTYDVLGRLKFTDKLPDINHQQLQTLCRNLEAKPITLPYPVYSSKTVHGKPLHTWALEERLGEIDIPNKTSFIYKLKCTNLFYKTGQEIYDDSTKMINSLPPVTDARKALGADFRRQDVRKDWSEFLHLYQDTKFPVASFQSTVSSGTYIRSLSIYLGQRLNTISLAGSIERTRIGKYQPIFRQYGFWRKVY